jgi:hypothetical protein
MGSHRGGCPPVRCCWVPHGGISLLVQKHLTVLPARGDHLLEASNTGLIRLRALEETAVSTNCVAYAILCCAVEFCKASAMSHVLMPESQTFRSKDNWVVRP